MDVHATDREVDITSAQVVADSIRTLRPDAVVHLAAQSSVAASWKDPLSAYRLNYLGSLNLLRALEAQAPEARVLLIGSSDCYGSDADHTGRPISEADPLRPESPYARTKAAAEQLGALAAERGLSVVRVRAFTHIGAGQTDAFVASSFARQVAEIAAGLREPRMRVGNLDSVRDFLDVRDVIEAYVRLLDPAVPVGTYNVASGKGVPIRALLDQLFDLAGVDADIEVDPERYRPTDYRIGDSTKLREASGWAPRIELRETLSGILESWRHQVAPADA